MSTTGVSSWAVDLKDVSAIYPFQGSESLLVGICVVLWIGWHIWQIRSEQKSHANEIARSGDKATVTGAINGD